jgi:hypothetical protein
MVLPVGAAGFRGKAQTRRGWRLRILVGQKMRARDEGKRRGQETRARDEGKRRGQETRARDEGKRRGQEMRARDEGKMALGSSPDGQCYLEVVLL